MKKRSLSTLNRKEMRSYIFEIQDTVKSYLNNGGSVDSFIDETNLIDDFESVLPDEEYPIFVITVLNDIKSDSVIDKLLDSILPTIQSKSLVFNS
jgi:hypothetical protein